MKQENEYFLQLMSRLNQIYNDNSIPMSEWVSNNLDFYYEDYEYQKKIMDDMHPDMVVIKCAQVGLTEVQLHKILGFAKRNRKTASIFTLPNEKMFKRVSQARLLPLIKSHPILDLPDQVRSMSTIEIGDSWIYVTGCTEGDATSIAADALFHDEFDLSPQPILGLFQSRLQNSKYRITQRFSTPSFVGYGVDRFWGVSDQNEYCLQCSSCNYWNIPKFEVGFIGNLRADTGQDLSEVDLDQDFSNTYLRCEKCGERLVPKNKEWVATNPAKTNIRGYKIRPLATTRLDPPYIFNQLRKYKNMNNLRGWYNTVLGEPYTDSNARISESDILACMGINKPEWPEKCFVGIDVGQLCHIVIGKFDPDPVITFMDSIQVKDLSLFISGLMKSSTIIAGVCDRYPYTPTANEIRDLSSGVIMPAEYRETVDLTKLVADEFGANDHVVLNRTRFLDEVAKRIRTRKIVINGFTDQQNIVVSHLRDMVREETPDKPPRWLKLSGIDHYFHATAYFLASFVLKSVLDQGLDIETRSHYFIDSFTFKDKPKWQYSLI